jgi:hypothetical protein
MESLFIWVWKKAGGNQKPDPSGITHIQGFGGITIYDPNGVEQDGFHGFMLLRPVGMRLEWKFEVG